MEDEATPSCFNKVKKASSPNSSVFSAAVTTKHTRTFSIYTGSIYTPVDRGHWLSQKCSQVANQGPYLGFGFKVIL